MGLPSYLIPNVFICLMQELDHLVGELEKIAVVSLLQRRSIISLIGNVRRSSLILEKVSFSSRLSLVLYRNFLIKWTFLTRLHSYNQAFHVFRNLGVNVQMISQGASKVSCCPLTTHFFCLVFSLISSALALNGAKVLFPPIPESRVLSTAY